MDSMDNVRERFEALEQQMQVMGAHTSTVERRLRWWRGIACGLLLVGLVSLPLPSGTARDEQPTTSEYRGIKERLAALEYKLQYVTGGEDEVVITGANLRIVNGLGNTQTTNGLGNLIVGYNEPRGFEPDRRTGSHNVVMGRAQNFSSFGGLVIGFLNEISGQFATVSGGRLNTASGDFSSVSGGVGNTASGDAASVSGGNANTASGFSASVSGGNGNLATSGVAASVSGGQSNTASGTRATVSGGFQNTASGDFSSVSGGSNRTAPGTGNWAAGPLFADN